MSWKIWNSYTTHDGIAPDAGLDDVGDQPPNPTKGPATSNEERNAALGAGDAQEIQTLNRWDPNLPSEKGEVHVGTSQAADEEMKLDVDPSKDSPYEAVQAAVRNTDGGEVANTVRAWILGIVFVTIGSAVNMFLSMRYSCPISVF